MTVTADWPEIRRELRDDAEGPLIHDDSGCEVALVGDELQVFIVHAVDGPAERILTGEAAPRRATQARGGRASATLRRRGAR